MLVSFLMPLLFCVGSTGLRIRRTAEEHYQMAISGRAPPSDTFDKGVASSFAEAAEASEYDRASRRNEGWIAAQRDAFRAAINGAPLETSLAILIRSVIDQAAGKPRCAFYINTGHDGLRHVVGMSESYAERIRDFEILPGIACLRIGRRNGQAGHHR
jgi:hypothetical protein